MQNREIRQKILNELYRKYYEKGFSQPLDTISILQSSGIPANLNNLAYTNVIYLEKSFLINGEYTLGTSYPKFVSINTNGINTVEQSEKELAKLHDDVRFKILTGLYDYYFGNKDEDTLLVDVNFVKSLGLTELDEIAVRGDINYLYDIGLIEGFKQLGLSYPYRIKITANGIDVVERAIDQSLTAIGQSNLNEQPKVEEIINEMDQRTKLQKFRDFVGENAGWIELVANVFRASIGGG